MTFTMKQGPLTVATGPVSYWDMIFHCLSVILLSHCVLHMGLRKSSGNLGNANKQYLPKISKSIWYLGFLNLLVRVGVGGPLAPPMYRILEPGVFDHLPGGVWGDCGVFKNIQYRVRPPGEAQFGLAKQILFFHINRDLIGTCIIKIDNYHTNNLQLLKHVKYIAQWCL